MASMLQLNPILKTVKPAFLERAVTRKYGNVYVKGAYEVDVDNLLDKIQYRAVQFGEPPREIARQVIDIIGREHINCGDEEDEVIIGSNKKEEESKEKTFQLKFSKSWSYTAGGGVKVGGQFFNVASASIGLEASYSKEKKEETSYEEVVNESVSQNYGILGTLKVAPKTKLKATITTWAVTYQARTVIEVSCPNDIWIPVRIQHRFVRAIAQAVGLTCDCCKRIVYISARDIFREEPEFREEEDYVFFTRETSMSYLGETIEVKKEESPSNIDVSLF